MMKNVKHPLSHRQRQALATRQLILDVARALFLEQGYGATTIEAISQQAGLAVSTVYSIYKNKRGILNAIREDWHAESEQREIYHTALHEYNAERRMDFAASATRRQWATGATLIAIYSGAAAVDLEAAAELNEALAGRRAYMTQFIHATAPMLRPDLSPERATAIYLALTCVEVYQELVEAAGWSPDDYERWLAAALKQQLLP